MKSLSEIKTELASFKDADLPLFIDAYKDDVRTGVVKIVESAKKKHEKYVAETIRMHEMFHYERLYDNKQYIAGIDEVGRGPLAGPVVTCAVILPKDCDLLYLNDSKKVPEKMREELYDKITANCVAFGIGINDHTVIDDINILNATKDAMKQAIDNLSVKPDQLLVDAVTIPDISIDQRAIIKGDAKCASIAAASIVAKVTRDRMMVEFDKMYPGYDFASNKGYGSAKHIEALKTLGPCPIHRHTFIQNFI